MEVSMEMSKFSSALINSEDILSHLNRSLMKALEGFSARFSARGLKLNFAEASAENSVQAIKQQ